MGGDRIDGTVEAVWLKKRRENFAIYDRMLFRLPNGAERSLGKSLVSPEVADRLVPGTRGRFYLYSAVDHKGVAGVRDAAGGAVFGIPRVNETAIMAVAAVNVTWLVLAVAIAGAVPLLPLLLSLFSVPLYFLYRSTRVSAKRQFDADASYVPPAA